MLRGLLGGFARGRRQTSAATLVLDFLAGLNDSRITYSGGANGTRVNSSGNIVAATTPRFDYDPVTLAAKGLLVEEARTNSLRNNSMTGVAAGSPGTAPTSWPMSSTGGVLTRTLSAAGTANGIVYFDCRFQFSAAGTAFITMEANNQIAATNGQSWSLSSWCALQAGSLTNISAVGHIISEYSAAVAFLTNGVSNFTPDATLTRRTFTRTNTDAACAFVGPGLYITATGAADITLRIGYPQMELGAFATSVIPTTSASVTKTSDVGAMTSTNFSSFYNQAGGTLVASFDVITTVAGTRPIVSFDDNTANERIELYASGTDLRMRVIDGGATQVDMSIGTIAANTTYKAAISFAANDFAGCLNGGTVATDTSGTLPTPDRMRLGSNQAGNYQNGHLRSISYYPTARPNSLQALTA